ncbi:OmpA family protein [Zhongshania sp. BJYM1]|uniref:OmpA family protein n=1 Tax=Zhongshania aquatica TaxID=2965069 RepID=UPI0022B578DF|nr:OmpA family protein [Marortus sp. BJYM1]
MAPAARAQIVNVEILGTSIIAPVTDVLADVNLLASDSGGMNELLGVDLLGSDSLLGVSVSGQDILLLGAPIAGGGSGADDLSGLSGLVDGSQGAVLEFLQDTAMGDINPTVLTLSLPGSDGEGSQGTAEFDDSKDNKSQSESNQLSQISSGKADACEDKDRDSVCDSVDQCLSSPLGAMVLPTGCHFDRTKPLALQGVSFAVGTAEITASSTKTLQRVVQMITFMPDTMIEVGGHTDDVGSDSANQYLSEKRALAVKDYLVAAGVPEKQLVIKGYGETQAAASIEGLSGRALSDARSQNRRVEVRVLGEYHQP